MRVCIADKLAELLQRIYDILTVAHRHPVRNLAGHGPALDQEVPRD
jgi:hypothetical protein